MIQIKLHKNIWFTLVVLSICNCVWAQVGFTDAKIINLKSNLSQASVNALQEDELGNIWVGTQDGLNKIDGSKTKVFRANPKPTGGLRSSKIHDLFLDRNRHLFVYHLNGLSILNLLTETWIEDSLFNTHTISAPYNLNDSTIVFHDEQRGLFSLNTNTWESTQMLANRKELIRDVPMQNLFQFKDDWIFVFKDGHIVNDHLKKTDAFDFTLNLNYSLLYENIIYFFTNDNGLISYNINQSEFESIPLQVSKTILWDGHIYNNQILCFSYGHGTFSYNPTTKKVSQFYSGSFLKQFQVCGEVDRDGNLWIGTDGDGIILFNHSNKIFDITSKERLGSVRSIKEKANALYIATYSNGLFIQENGNTKKPNWINNIIGEKKLLAIEIIGNQLWMGYDEDGIDILHLNHKQLIKRIKSFSENPKHYPKNVICKIMNKGRDILVGTRYEGFYVIDKETFKIKKKIHTDNSNIPANKVRNIYLRNNKTIVLGLEDRGISVLDSNFQILHNVEYLKGTKYTFSTKSFYEDLKGNLWVGTDGSGILIFDKKYQQIKQLTAEDGLNNNTVYALMPQGNEALWVSTNAGLSRFNHTNQSITNIVHFNEENGLQANEFNTNAYLKTSTNEFVFGGLNNINRFDPADVTLKNKVHTPVINSFKISNKEVQLDTIISHKRNLTLEPTQRNFSLGFSTTGYSSPGAVQYSYRLLGASNKWENIGSRNYVTFTNLSHGQYTFQVRSSSVNGVWDKNYNSLTITLKAPFYRTWPFYIALVLLGLFLVYSLFRYRIIDIAKQNKNNLMLILDSQEEERKRISKELHDDIGAKLSTIKLYLKALEKKGADELVTSTYTMVDESIVSLRSILKNLSPKSIEQEGLVPTLESFFYQINQTGLMHCECDIYLKDKVQQLPSYAIYRIILELTNNTLKHAQANKIGLNMTQRDNLVSILYNDNGIGFDKEKINQGYGTTNIQNYVSAFDGKIEIESSSKLGTTIHIEFPTSILA